MTYDTYRLIFIVGAITFSIMLTVSVILFIVLKIPNVIGDLSGRNARKAIENIRKQNEQSGDKRYKSSAVNLERGKLTDKISASGNIQKRSNTRGFGMHTEKISTMKLEQNVSEETTVLESNGSEETTVLADSNFGETTVLSEQSQNAVNYNETTVLHQFAVLEDITFIHTDEYI